MQMTGMEIGQIATLSTQVATVGTVRGVDVATYDLFELLIGIVILIYEIDPNF